LKNKKKKGQICTLTRRERRVERRKKKRLPTTNHQTTTDMLHIKRKSMWQHLQWHDRSPFFDNQWRHTRRRKSIDTINALACEKDTPSTFQDLILKINVRLLKKTPITLEITNKPMWKDQSTLECIEAILSYPRAKKYFTYFNVCAKSKKPLVSRFKFHWLWGRRVFLLYKIIWKVNDAHVQFFINQ
jgi:hypothetical protein